MVIFARTDSEYEDGKFVFKRMVDVPLDQFDYNQVVRGDSVILANDDILGMLVSSNRHLKFHLSEDRYFGTQYSFAYSKSLRADVRETIDLAIRSLTESGLHQQWMNKHFELVLSSVAEDDSEYQDVTHDDFAKLMLYLGYCMSCVILEFIVEIATHNHLHTLTSDAHTRQ